MTTVSFHAGEVLTQRGPVVLDPMARTAAPKTWPVHHRLPGKPVMWPLKSQRVPAHRAGGS